jgi:hypothetical protein
MDLENDRIRPEQTSQPPKNSWLLVGGGLAFSLAVLGLLLLLQMQFAGGPQPVTDAESLRVVPPPAMPTNTPPAEPRIDERPPRPARRSAPPGIGRSFRSRADFGAQQQREEFVVIGRFDDTWPATVIDEETAMHEISFTRQNRTRHRYPNLHGYRLKVVRLRTHEGSEAVLVLRSKERE